MVLVVDGPAVVVVVVEVVDEAGSGGSPLALTEDGRVLVVVVSPAPNVEVVGDTAVVVVVVDSDPAGAVVVGDDGRLSVIGVVSPGLGVQPAGGLV